MDFMELQIRINRREFSGAFGDMGTDLPLLTGMILASELHAPTVLLVFGLAQVASALFYGIPMPVQPLKAVAALVIAGGVTQPQILGAGLCIGLIMMALTASGMLNRLRDIIPLSVIRGIQLGLGVKLMLIAMVRYVPSDGISGLVLAGLCAVVVLFLLNNRTCPPALPVIAIGLVYAFLFKFGDLTWAGSFGWSMPRVARFTLADVIQGGLVLALPQIPLSLGNSLLATHQMAEDLFPERKIKLQTIGYTYSILNILMPFVGGVPVCHGSGGMAGHYLFGGRTGGSVFIYGVILIVFGLFFGSGFENVIQVFPLPVLGVILMAEGIMLMRFVGDVMSERFSFAVAVVTATCSVLLPCGFLIGMIAGTCLVYFRKAFRSALRTEMAQAAPEEIDA